MAIDTGKSTQASLSDNCERAIMAFNSAFGKGDELKQEALKSLAVLGPAVWRLYLDTATGHPNDDDLLDTFESLTVRAIECGKRTLQDSQSSKATRLLAIAVLRSMSETVATGDEVAFENLAWPSDSSFDPNRLVRFARVGTASLDAAKALAELLKIEDSDVRGSVLLALGAAFKAHDVFFRAIGNLCDGARAPDSSVDDPAASPQTRALQTLFVWTIDPKEITYHYELVEQLVSVLESTDAQASAQAVNTLGDVVPSALRFANLVAVQRQRGVPVRPLVAHQVFRIASSAFEAVFALAHATQSRDVSIGSRAMEAIQKIIALPLKGAVVNVVKLMKPPPVRPKPFLLILLPDPPTLPDDEVIAVENEAFNALHSIPAATVDTIDGLGAVVGRPNDDEHVERALRVRNYMMDVAGAMADEIAAHCGHGGGASQRDLESDLFNARRYYLILDRFERAVPRRIERYLRLLELQSSVSSGNSLLLRRLVVQETLRQLQKTHWSDQDPEMNCTASFSQRIARVADSLGPADPTILGQMKEMLVALRRLDSERSVFYRLITWLQARSATELAGIVISVIYGVAVFAAAVLWTFMPWQFARWAMYDPSRAEVPDAFKRLVQFVALVRWLGGSSRALDSWAAKEQDRLIQHAFLTKDGVQYRIDHYVDLGNQQDVDAFCAKVNRRDEARLHITATGGGSGKTTLACHVAQSALLVARKAGFPLIVVLVRNEWKGSLSDAVTRRLEIGDRRLRPAMLENLARRGRILAVVDGLTEIDSAPVVDEPFRYMITTSRQASADPNFATVTVGDLTRERLTAFIEIYANDTNVRSIAQGHIDSLRRDRPIRPVFAWMVIKNVNEGATENQPKSYRQLIGLYVHSLRPTAGDALNVDSYGRAAKLAGYLVVEKNLAPSLVLRDTMQAQIRTAGNLLPFKDSKGGLLGDDQVLDQLVECGLLRKAGISLSSYMGFAFDVIAEHLAATYLVESSELLANIKAKRTIPRTLEQLIADAASELAEAIGASDHENPSMVLE